MNDNTAVISIQRLTKHYAGVKALTDGVMEIARGEVRALLGRNGAGKSTMIRLISGVEDADAGVIDIDGKILTGGVRHSSELGVETVHQELSLVPQMTVAENLFLGVWPRAQGRIDYAWMKRETAAVFERLNLDIDPNTLVEDLSIAEQQLVEISRAVRRKPKVLILDEPTSALAAAEVTTVLEAVRSIAAGGVAVIYVSHRLDEIRRVATSATVLRDGRVVETVQLEQVTTQHVVDLMLGDATGEQERPELMEIDRSGEPIISIESLSAGPKVDDVSLNLYPGEVLGLAGLMGSGRSETLRAIAGFDPIERGTVRFDGVDRGPVSASKMKKLGLGMTPEDRKGSAIVPLLGVDENLVLADYSKVSRGLQIGWARLRERANELISRLSVATASPETPIVNLSGGNQQKVVIGRWLHAESRVLLLDEPTRGVDVRAKGEIYSLIRNLAERGTAIVFVSGELEELPLVCDRVAVMRHGRIAEEICGEDISTQAVVTAAMGTE